MKKFALVAASIGLLSLGACDPKPAAMNVTNAEAVADNMEMQSDNLEASAENATAGVAEDNLAAPADNETDVH